MTILEVGQARIGNVFGNAADYIALIKTDGDEVSGGGYARVACRYTRSTEQGNTDQLVNPALDFGTTTAAWGTVNKYRIYSSATSTDAATAAVYEGDLTQQTIGANVAVTAAAGALPIEMR